MANEVIPETPAAAPTPAATAAPATPETHASPVATPQVTHDPAIQGTPEAMVPSYRLRETREAAERAFQQQWSQRETDYETKIRQYQDQLRALVGVTPNPNVNPEVEAVRKQFGGLYPGLSKMEEKAERLMELLDRAEDLEVQNSHYWASYARSNMDRLYSLAEQTYGAPLSEDGKRSLHASFAGFLQTSPELAERYTNDPRLVEEFWKQFTSSFVDPVRRTATATVENRAPRALPQDAPSGTPQGAAAPKPADLEERAAQAWATYQQTKR